MATERGSWSSVHSEDLPEGLSDRGEDSFTRRRILRQSLGRQGLWALTTLGLRGPTCPSRTRWLARPDLATWRFMRPTFNAGVRFPMQPLMRELLDRLNLAPGQLAPNAWRTVVGSMVMWKVLSEGKDDLTLDELLFCYKPCQIPASPGFWSLNMRQRGLKLIVGTPSSNREWKDNYVFVCGDNWEGLQCEKDDNFIPVRREWGVPSSSALRRPKLDENGHNRVLRSLHHTQHHYKHFIRPELLALYSFGPEPSEAVLSLQEINQKSSLRSRRRYLGTPPWPVVGPKAAVTKDDLAEYDKVNTDVIKVAGVHSLMKGLTELTVIANRCTQWEEALLKQKIRMVVGELSSAKADLTRKDEDLRRALDDVNRADEQVKKLTSQLEVAVEDFKSSEAYDDNNTKYFLSGFSFLKKQAKEKYPELDFEAFQPFDDDESVMPVGDDNAGPSTDPQMDDDATS
uniref:Uncharacterized protein n=1 Tax=Fagus sylvatica TaxID=28930 RepID=A0A2N9I7P4_FAGSY